MLVLKKVEAQEAKGRFIVKAAAKEIFGSAKRVEFKDTPILNSTDLEGNVYDDKGAAYPVHIEIKENSGTWPCALLRQDKLGRMKQCAETTGALLTYVCLYPEENTGYVFWIDRLDFKKFDLRTQKLKQTQLDPNSPEKLYNVYYIPKTEAVKTFKLDKYYALYKQAQKGN